MLKIGEFAWLGQVTVETLRHYDRLGLLKPEQLDPFTGYRYYALEQLPRLNRILALKDLGLSLEEITRMLARPVKPDEIRSILAGQQVRTGARGTSCATASGSCRSTTQTNRHGGQNARA